MWLAVFRQRAQSAEEVDRGMYDCICACFCASVCDCERQTQKFYVTTRPGKLRVLFYRWFFGLATIYFSVHYVCAGMCVSACWLVAGRSWAEKKYLGRPREWTHPLYHTHREREREPKQRSQPLSIFKFLHFSTLLPHLKT